MSEDIQLGKEPQVQIPVLSKEEHVWLQAWTSVARAGNHGASSSATIWADNCLKDFKARFKNI